jgi:hypothetical protein
LIDRKIDCEMLFQSNLVLQLVTPQKRRGTETRQHKSIRFRRGWRAWMAPTGVSRAKVIAGLGPGLIAIGVFGLGNGCLKAAVKDVAAASRLTKPSDLSIVTVS